MKIVDITRFISTAYEECLFIPGKAYELTALSEFIQ